MKKDKLYRIILGLVVFVYGFILISCGPEEDESQVILSTTSASNFFNTADIKGQIVSNNLIGTFVYGVVYSDKNTEPIVNQDLNTSLQGTPSTEFIVTVKDLNWGSTYYFRTYIQSQDGDTFYSSNVRSLIMPGNPNLNSISPVFTEKVSPFFQEYKWSSTANTAEGSPSYKVLLTTTVSDINKDNSILQVDLNTSEYTSFRNLDFNTKYYWQVVSTYDKNSVSLTSPIDSFQTFDKITSDPISYNTSNPNNIVVMFRWKRIITSNPSITHVFFLGSSAGTLEKVASGTELSTGHNYDFANNRLNVGTSYSYQIKVLDGQEIVTQSDVATFIYNPPASN